MINADKFVNGKSKLLRLGDEFLGRYLFKIWPPGKDPNIPARWTGYQCPIVTLIIKVGDMISASKRPEERDRKACDIPFALKYGMAGGVFPSAG